MTDKEFTGYGSTIDEAIDAASQEALKTWEPAGPDDQVSIKINATSVLYGGITGHVGTRVARVSLAGRTGFAAEADASTGKAVLALKLDVQPDTILVNLIPPVHHPQRRTAALVLTVTNVGEADYKGESNDSPPARFSVLKGRTTIWKSPEQLAHHVAKVSLRPRESHTFTAVWEIEDAVGLAGAELRGVGLFAPSGHSAMHAIQIRAAF